MLREGIGPVKAAWAEASPGIPDDFTFLDDDIRRQYGEVERWRKVVGFASAFTVVIAALGLVGLTALTVARRRKEIGVRKVLGASPGRILVMFSADFGKLVLAANLVAWPIAYLAMRRWLQDFAYRIGHPGLELHRWRASRPWSSPWGRSPGRRSGRPGRTRSRPSATNRPHISFFGFSGAAHNRPQPPGPGNQSASVPPISKTDGAPFRYGVSRAVMRGTWTVENSVS